MNGSRRTAVVADAHLGGPGGAPGPLVEQLRSLPAAGCERLVLLGDLFQAWVALPAFETAAVRRVLEAVGELRAAGVEVDYVEGNRDFFVGEAPYRRHFDAVGTELAFVSGGRRVLAVHGDGLDARDRRYRAWRRVSKSMPVRLGMRLLPSPLARRLVERTERGLSATNLEHKRSVPEELLRDYGERRLAEGYELLLLGHFHAARRWVLPEGEVRLLDPWYESRRVEWVP